jgi:hypothetical protein
MGRKSKPIDPHGFQATVNRLEADREFPSPYALWKAVAETDWAKGHNPPLSVANLYRLAKLYRIEHKTRRNSGRPMLEIEWEKGVNIRYFVVYKFKDIHLDNTIINYRGSIETTEAVEEVERIIAEARKAEGKPKGKVTLVEWKRI